MSLKVFDAVLYSQDGSVLLVSNHEGRGVITNLHCQDDIMDPVVVNSYELAKQLAMHELSIKKNAEFFRKKELLQEKL